MTKSLHTKVAGTAPSKDWFPATHTHVMGKPSNVCITMITLLVDYFNPISQKSYDELLFQLQFHQLTCSCGRSGCLSIHGYYNRSLKLSSGLLLLRICRVICSSCGRTHALLPSTIVPYSQISLPEQVALITFYENQQKPDPVMAMNPLIDESNYRYILSKYLLYWKQRLLAERIILFNHLLLSSKCILMFSMQFMQIKCTPNILFMNTT